MLKFLLSDVGDGVGTRNASVVGVFGVADRLARPPLEWHPFFLLEASTNSMAEEYSKGFGQGNCFRKGHVLAVTAVRSTYDTLLLLPTNFHFRSAEIMGDGRFSSSDSHSVRAQARRFCLFCWRYFLFLH